MEKELESVSVFFPAYNDAATISGLVEKTYGLLKKTGRDFEILVINDGSTDDTSEVLERLRQQYGCVLRVITHPCNRGYGAALRSGFAAATKDLVFYTDGDGQYDPTELSMLLARAESSVDWVNGYKIKRSDALHRVIIGKVYNALVRTLFRLRIRDVDCDFRLIRRRLLAGVRFHSDNGVICIELAKALQSRTCTLAEVPVHHYPRVAGRSQFFRWRSLLRTFTELTSLLCRQNEVRRGWQISTVFGIALLLVTVTRFPLMPKQLFSFDSVNFALALEDFDPGRNQPQPPGYPFFIGEAKLLNRIFVEPERTFTFLKILISSLAVGLLYFLGKRMFSRAVGLGAAALFLLNPILWYSGLTSPLRPHLALFSILVAYLCWSTLEGDRRSFDLASLALGLGSGFRPSLLLILLPLWAWIGWRTGKFRRLLRGAILLAASSAVWVVTLTIACGGVSRMIAIFAGYANEQTQQTSLLLGASLAGWRRMAGRAVLWTGLSILPWVWAIPAMWKRRAQWLNEARRLPFLALWFMPGFLFYLLIHVADPDHTLTIVPAACLFGGFSLVTVEHAYEFRWIAWLKQSGVVIWFVLFCSYFLLYIAEGSRKKWFVVCVGLILSLLFLFPHSTASSRGAKDSGRRESIISLPLLANFALSYFLLYIAEDPKQKLAVVCVGLMISLLLLFPRSVTYFFGREGTPGAGALISLALLSSVFLFFVEFPVPHRTATAQFRGWSSVTDALLIGTYETSYARVEWVNEMTKSTLADIATLKSDKSRPLVVVWHQDGTPSWRKVTYYHPAETVYVLDENSEPGILAAQVGVWKGKALRSRWSGVSPIRLALPKRARLVWLLGGGRIPELGRVVSLQKAQTVYYTDLPDNARSFRLGSFELVPGDEQSTSRIEVVKISAGQQQRLTVQ